MISFALNLLFTRASSEHTIFQLIQGAPIVPSLALLLIALFVCPESPRYYLLKGPNYSVQRAYEVLRKVRNTEVLMSWIGPLIFASSCLTQKQLQALRDMYVVHKSIELENMDFSDLDSQAFRSPGFFWVMRDFTRHYLELLQYRRLRNAMISTSTVNLAQQLCGGESRMKIASRSGFDIANLVGAAVNVCAFYSGKNSRGV